MDCFAYARNDDVKRNREPMHSALPSLHPPKPLAKADGGERSWGVYRGSTGMIIDISDRHDSRQFPLSGLFTRSAEPLTKRSERGEQTAAALPSSAMNSRLFIRFVPPAGLSSNPCHCAAPLHHPSLPTSASTSDQHFEPSFSFQIA